MENASSSTSPTCCIMSFGNNSATNGLCPISMMPLITSSHPQHPPPDHSSNNTIFPPLLPPLNSLKNNHNRNSSTASSLILDDHNPNACNNTNPATGYYFMDGNTTDVAVATATHSNVKAKIMSHPHFQRLLAAYANCQKVGAPAEVVDRLEEACASAATMGQSGGSSSIGEDPALDQFMEAYCEMLCKYEQELSKPLKEAMMFFQRVESQFKALTLSSPPTSACHDTSDRNASSEEEVDVNNVIDPQAEDQALKGQLLRRYSGYLGSLKQEFMKKRKKGKLPKEARQQLLEWWNRHNKWPYPSESQKLALAESTGLDQKQINNWFINQRKRHWKPSEDMPFVVMDTTHPHYYVDNVLGHPFLMDHSSAML